MKIISIIPARSGSKSIKNKNLAIFAGKPLIYHSIKQSINCKMINRTIVSTDSKKIMKLAINYGAECPFIRPKNISKDNSKDISFIRHCLSWLKKNENYTPDLIVQLRPTQPIRSNNVIEKCIKKITQEPRADSLRTISIPERSPYKMWLKRGKFLEYLFSNNAKKDFFNMDRRRLPKVYWHDGLVDIIRYSTVFQYDDLIGKKMLYHVNKPKYHIDIDSHHDLVLANLLNENKLI